MKKNKKTHFMAAVLIILFISAFLMIMGRFIYIQATGVVNDVSLKDWAKEKRTSAYTIDAERGKIYDANGKPLAYDRLTYRVYAILDETYSNNSDTPKHVIDLKETAKELALLLDVEEGFILERLETGVTNESFQVEFGAAGKELSQDARDEIIALNLSGINFEEKPVRYYPNRMFASHILGFARNEGDKEVVGVTGIENEMNDLLSGEDGYVSYQRDRYNSKLLDPNEVVKKSVDGNDVHLTIDQKIQTLLEDVMSEVEEEYQPERITAVIMNAKTGEVVAMSNRPTYDPNNPLDVKNWYNDAISTPVEPGSTVKMFTWAAAIDAGVYKADEWYESGSYQINERIQKINDHNGGRGWGTITYDEGFERSSNVAASKLVWEKLGTEKYLEYLKAFDLDEVTNIDLPGEISGKILYNWPLEKITAAFGQGSTLTPIQQMKAATAITNKGKMLQPYVIKKVVDPSTGEIIEETGPKVVGEPISENTAEQVIDLLARVVESENGTGQTYKLEDYSIIGKTGTAEIPNPKGGGYLRGKNRNIFSFLGMAPKDDPELMMFVSVNQPKLAGHELGSAPVAYIFKSVMENSLHYLNITPDKEVNEPIQAIKVPMLVGEDRLSVEDALTSLGLKATIIGEGKKILATSIEQGTELFVNDRIILLTDKPVMPDITNWSLRDVFQLADLLKLNMEYMGTGYIITQSIEVGTALKENDYLGVELKPPERVEAEEDITEEETEE